MSVKDGEKKRNRTLGHGEGRRIGRGGIVGALRTSIGERPPGKPSTYVGVWGNQGPWMIPEKVRGQKEAKLGGESQGLLAGRQRALFKEFAKRKFRGGTQISRRPQTAQSRDRINFERQEKRARRMTKGGNFAAGSAVLTVLEETSSPASLRLGAPNLDRRKSERRMNK